mmetsp:Transcript_25017/g.21350  ORF Transcript_25017/g.21350 Transcript_25017/m.21350 type:complete len:93 (+) Transcript_25017:290-568(+)
MLSLGQFLIKTVGMMKCICHFYDQAQKCLAENHGDKTIGWAQIATGCRDVIIAITNMKFEMPQNSEEYFEKFFANLVNQIDNSFQKLVDEAN